MTARSVLGELVQALLGDLDGHPERADFTNPDVDDLGRPWHRGSKRRDRDRVTALATSNGGSGATVSCEGSRMDQCEVTNGQQHCAHRKRAVGTSWLSQLVREALVCKMVTNAERRRGRSK